MEVQRRLEYLRRLGVALEVTFTSRGLVTIREKSSTFDRDNWDLLWSGSYDGVPVFLKAYAVAHRRLARQRPPQDEGRRSVVEEGSPTGMYGDYLGKWEEWFGADCLLTTAEFEWDGLREVYTIPKIADEEDYCKTRLELHRLEVARYEALASRPYTCDDDLEAEVIEKTAFPIRARLLIGLERSISPEEAETEHDFGEAVGHEWEPYEAYMNRWRSRFGTLSTGKLTINTPGTVLGPRQVTVKRLTWREHLEAKVQLAQLGKLYNETYKTGDAKKRFAVLGQAEHVETKLLV